MKTVFFAVLAAAAVAQGQVIKGEQPLAVSAGSTNSPVTAPNAALVSKTGTKNLIFRIYNSCFGTNLRGVANPLAPTSIIHANMTIKVGDRRLPVRVEYPAAVVTSEGMSGASAQPIQAGKFSLPGGGRASIFGNIVQLEIPNVFTTDTSVATTGDVTTEIRGGEKVTLADDWSFVQQVTTCDGPPAYGQYGYSQYIPSYNCGDYMGKNGDVNFNINNFTVSGDQTVAELSIAFPGQVGFCGGYFSPLMLFFDDVRPQFKEVSSFPVNPYGKTRWPEAGAPGYFLTLDRDGDGKITRGDELFGDGGKDDWNGFKELAKLDKNKDKKIDARDPKYAELRAWRDLNGDGVSQADELFTLKVLGVRDISLKYKSGTLRVLGDFAQERERSTFTYKKNGKTKTGDIVDIWMSPVLQKVSEK